MIHYIATKLTKFYIKNKKIDLEDEEVYVYCFDIAISTILNFLILVIIALLTKKFYESIIFGVCFIFLRNFSGGLHAKTHFGCSLLLVFVIICWLICINKMDVYFLRWSSYLMLVISYPFILIFAPVDNSNNIIDIKRKKKYKIKCFVILLLEFIVYLILSILRLYTYSFIISYTIFAVFLSMIIQIIINLRNKIAL